ncbi:MAG: hypothetical protein ACYTBP_05030 [Planctomycetota bacterium]|jgi:hypothetical protein
MDIYDSLFTAGCVLNEQIARHVFEIMPDNGPVIVIIDKAGHHWPSDTERFHKLNITESLLLSLCAKIDDGHEPVVAQHGQCSVVVAQLATDRTNCGYVMMAMDKSKPESNLVNFDLIEIILSQIGLIARLIEKNDLLYELQMKQTSLYGQGQQSQN